MHGVPQEDQEFEEFKVELKVCLRKSKAKSVGAVENSGIL
jgi:hypothetical protein